MTINKGTIAITIATLALVISCYGTFFKDQPSSLNKPKQQQLSPTVSISTPAEYQQSNEALIDELSKKVSSLQRKVANLHCTLMALIKNKIPTNLRNLFLTY